jgi:uncharacterized RDD family membrane protein YckC
MEDTSPQVDAGLWSRMLAFGCDYLLICGYILVLVIISTLLRRPLGALLAPVFSSPIRRDLGAFAVLILPVLLYSAAGESSPSAATWGKRKRGLQVLDTQGNRLSRQRAFARAALKFLPWQVAHTSLFHIPGWPMAVESVPIGSTIGFGLVWALVGIYAGSILLHRQHRAVYDQLLGACVSPGPGA